LGFIMANILANACNKEINEEGEKMDKQQIKAPGVNPTTSPNNVETNAAAKAKALGGQGQRWR
jgi:hypothetical protein